MKKIVKMSLVAAVAVAGLTTANAKPLEEAIKDVDVSGTVVYRYNDILTDDAAVGALNSTGSDNNYKIGINIKSKVNDDVTANFRLLTGTTITSTSFANLPTDAAGDANPSIHLSNVYFGYTGIANTTVNVGKQGLTTPWTVATDADSNEQTGTGILALTTVGPVTLAGAYFNQTNLGTSGYTSATLNALASSGNAGSNDLAAIAAIANVGPVTIDAWYAQLENIFDSYTIGAKAGFDLEGVNLGIDARYTALELDKNILSAVAGVTDLNNEHDMFKVALTAKAGIVDAKYVYAKTDKEGGIVSLDNDAATNVQGWGVSIHGKADADFHQFVLGVQATDSLHVSANYVEVEYNDAATIAGGVNAITGADNLANDSEEEIYIQALYKMSKNLSAYVRYGQGEVKEDGQKEEEYDYKGRLQIQYSF